MAVWADRVLPDARLGEGRLDHTAQISEFRLPTKLFLKSCAAAVMVLLFGASFSLAQNNVDGRVLFVLDGSNSMWGQIDGTAKITIAKEVMSDLITDWDEAVPVGLMVYGHRRKDDCRDIELVARPGAVDRDVLIDEIQSITPRGKTPITQSLINGALAIDSGSGKSSIVLVSDGLETCDADPCAAAFSFNVLNPGFDVHVIGFDVSEEESKALQCIADRSGGRFFAAGNADELKSALDETLAAAAVPATPPPAEPEPSLRLYAKFCDTCETIDPPKVHWTIQGAEGSTLYNGLGLLYPDGPEIAPGTYRVSARYQSSNLVREAELVIGQDGQQIGAVNLEGGSAVMFAYASDDETIAAEPIQYEFFPITDGVAAGTLFASQASSNAAVWLPAGRYKVVATHDRVKESAEIEIFAGQETRHRFDMRVGYFQPSAVLTDGGDPLGGNVDYEVYGSQADAEARANRIVFSLGAQNRELPLRAGDYFVRAIVTYQRKTQSVSRVFPFSIKGNQTTSPILNLQAGLLSHTVSSQSGKGISNIDYVRMSDDRRVAYYNRGGTNTLALEPGQYRLRVLSAGETYDTDPFEIDAGKTTTVDVAVP